MIILLRHATPLIEYGFCNYKGAKNRINSYNITRKVCLNEVDPYINTVKNVVDKKKKLIV